MDEVVQLELRAIRELIQHNEASRDAKEAIERESGKAWKSELDGRLSRMNEFRQAMSDQAAQFIARPEFEAAIAAGIERYEANRDYVDAQLTPVRENVSRISKTDWGLLASVGSIMIGVCAGCWLIIGLQIDNRVGPLRVDLEQTRAATSQNTERTRFLESATSASTQADVGSRADRAQINERLHQLEVSSPATQSLTADVSSIKSAMRSHESDIQRMNAYQTEQRAALVEIETQFCGQDNLRSQIHAQDLRVQSMLWKKVFGDDMPISNAFYARVGRCGTPGPAQ